ncbi:MAG: tyrosine-type recombinase/integrase [Clostridia bacterium]|nr:tyrosine-type recombinase/integrase [Clostridia bacterium]
MDINNNAQNNERLRKLLFKLPDLCYDFFIAASSNTSILTRINYANDLIIFFEYLYTQCDSFADIRPHYDQYVSYYSIDSENIGETLENNEDADEIQDKPPAPIHPSQYVNISHIKAITTKDIEEFLHYISSYEKNGYTYSNTNPGKKRKLSAISSFFTYLLKHRLISEDATGIIDSPKIKEKTILRLTPDEIVKLVQIVESGEGLTPKEAGYHKKTVLRDTAIIVLLLDTGIRLSELIGIDIKDIYFDENAFKVTRKGGSQAILYYSNYTKDILRAYISQREKIEIKGKDADALFISLQNNRITHRAVEKLVDKYTKIVNPLKNISPHKFRSTFGTALYHNTGDIYLVADVLGHKDVNTTKKHYAAISEDRRKEAPKNIDYFDD